MDWEGSEEDAILIVLASAFARSPHPVNVKLNTPAVVVIFTSGQ